MATDCIPQVTFEFYDKLKPVVARFDQVQASTDGGVVLIKALDDRLRLTEQLAGCLADRRDPDKIRQTIRALLRQRIMGLACGYEDANDAARLADDPLHKLAVGRDPVTGCLRPCSQLRPALSMPRRRGCCIGWDARWRPPSWRTIRSA